MLGGVGAGRGNPPGYPIIPRSRRCLPSGFDESSIVLFGCILSQETAFWAAEGHNRNHQIAFEFEIAKKGLIRSRTRVPMAAYGLSVVIRNEAAFHLGVAIWTGVGCFHLDFPVTSVRGK